MGVTLNNADYPAMSSTMNTMTDVIKILNEKGIRNKFKVAVGGGPISQAFCDRIGADGYAKNATEAVRLCQGFFK